jgi:hypothetical protein
MRPVLFLIRSRKGSLNYLAVLDEGRMTDRRRAPHRADADNVPKTRTVSPVFTESRHPSLAGGQPPSTLQPATNARF